MVWTELTAKKFPVDRDRRRQVGVGRPPGNLSVGGFAENESILPKKVDFFEIDREDPRIGMLDGLRTDILFWGLVSSRILPPEVGQTVAGQPKPCLGWVVHARHSSLQPKPPLSDGGLRFRFALPRLPTVQTLPLDCPP